jgi:hypothetical protein
VAAEVTEEAAARKNDPADLINIALERLVEKSLELPAFRPCRAGVVGVRVPPRPPP